METVTEIAARPKSSEALCYPNPIASSKFPSRALKVFGMSSGIFALIIVCIAGFTSNDCWAAALTWIGAPNGAWTTTTNWSPNGTPSSADTLTFTGGSASINAASAAGIMDITGTSFTINPNTNSTNVLTIGTGSSLGNPVTITGNALTFANQSAVALNANQTWNASSVTFSDASANSTLNLSTRTLFLGDGSSTFQYTFNGALVSGTGALVLTNAASLFIGLDSTAGVQANTFSGGITVNNGSQLIWGGNSTGAVTNGPLGTGTLTLNSGAIVSPGWNGAASTVANAFTMTGNVTVQPYASGNVFSGAGTLLGNVTFLQPVIFGSTGNITLFSGIISGSTRSITINNQSVGSLQNELDFSGANTFTGGMTINNGALVGLGSNSTGAITNGPVGTGTLTLSGGAIQSINAAHTVNNAVTLTAATNSTVTGTQNLTLGGVISGSGALTKNGTSNLTFSGASANTFSGGLTINQGQVTFSKTAGVNAIGAGASSVITINSGGTLALAAANQIPGGLNAPSMVLNGGLFSANGFSASSGIMGTLTLTANSTIDINAGSSIINFSDSSGTTWTTGATLMIGGWSGNPAGGGSDQLIFGSAATGLTGTQVNQIFFYNPVGFASGIYSAKILSTGEVVPNTQVPEPGTLIYRRCTCGPSGYRGTAQAPQTKGPTATCKVIALAVFAIQ